MLRTIHRAVRAGVGGTTPEPFSPSANSTTTTTRRNTHFNKKTSHHPNTALTVSSSMASGCNGNGNGNGNNGSPAFSSLINLPPVVWTGCTSPTCSEDLDWECVDGSEDERACGFYEDFVFGTVPSTDEVHHAVSALQRVLGASIHAGAPMEKRAKELGEDIGDEVTSPMSFNQSVSSVESEMDWVEPSIHLCESNTLLPRGSDRVYDAFHLLQTEPSVQRMVLSLSSDRAVWDAVLNNEVVKELRGSIQGDEEMGETERTDERPGGSNPVKDIMSWIYVNVVEKIMQLIDKIVKEVFQPANEEKRGGINDGLEEKLKASLFLSVVVLLIVVVTRAKSA